MEALRCHCCGMFRSVNKLHCRCSVARCDGCGRCQTCCAASALSAETIVAQAQSLGMLQLCGIAFADAFGGWTDPQWLTKIRERWGLRVLVNHETPAVILCDEGHYLKFLAKNPHGLSPIRLAYEPWWRLEQARKLYESHRQTFLAKEEPRPDVVIG